MDAYNRISSSEGRLNWRQEFTEVRTLKHLNVSTKQLERFNKAAGLNTTDLCYTKLKHTTMTKIWIITGSSRGLGRSLTAAVLANGDLVAATARNPEQLNELVKQYPDSIYPLKLDVTNNGQIAAAI